MEQSTDRWRRPVESKPELIRNADRLFDIFAGDTTGHPHGIQEHRWLRPVHGTVALVAGPLPAANFVSAATGTNKTVNFNGFTLAQGPSPFPGSHRLWGKLPGTSTRDQSLFPPVMKWRPQLMRPVDFFKRFVAPAFKGTNGIVYVLPESRASSHN